MNSFSHLMGQKVTFLYKSSIGQNFIIIGELVGFAYYQENDHFSLLIRDSKGREDFFDSYEYLQEFDDEISVHS